MDHSTCCSPETARPHLQAAAKQAPFLLRFCRAWIHTAMLTTEVSMLEKRKRYQEAVDLVQLLLGAHVIEMLRNRLLVSQGHHVSDAALVCYRCQPSLG